LAAAWAGAALIGTASLALAETPAPDSPQAKQEAAKLNALPPVAARGRSVTDHSGRKETGRASFYAHTFSHKKMANGRRFNPNDNVAASKTLPLGTTAKVVNTQNGKEATVKIEDRGPFVDGRVVDVSPKVADDLDLKKQGSAPVVVKPVAVPQPDGGVKLGAGGADASPAEVRQATQTTQQLTGDTQSDRPAR
jgi:rare lipoprotein A